MIRINLLPYRAARKKENVRNQVIVVFIIVTLVLTGLFGVNLHLNAKINDLNIKIAEIKTEVARVEKIAKKVDQIQKAIDTLNRKIAVINTLKLNRKEPVLLLDAMTRVIIAKRMWITSLEVSGNTVNINGIALDNKTVADFMTQLETAVRLDESELTQIKIDSQSDSGKQNQPSKWFSSVKLKTLKAQSIRKHNLKNFEISCIKAPLPQPAPDTAKQKK